MDLAFNDERLIEHSALASQSGNEHRHPYKTAAQDVWESALPTTYPELHQEYSNLSFRYAEMAKAYLKLEQEYALVSSQNAEMAKEYLKLEQECASITVSQGREQELQQQLAQSQAMLAGVLSSLSWRVTAPIRKLMAWFRRRR